MSDDYDYTEGGDYSAATIHYAGLTCGCGDYSCPAMTDDTQMCSYPDPGDYACTAQRSGDEDCICG